ncbi:MAG: hypothetical protein ACYCPS_01540 [Candidatus Saccharimonadales bacterium]
MQPELVPKIELYDQEHERQVRYDLITQFAELVDGSMMTKFGLEFIGDDLIGEDGRSLDKVTSDSLDEACAIAKRNPDLWFEKRRRSNEREEFFEAVDMARGEGPNTMIVVSDFPAELISATQDIGGYNVTRRQTMLRILTRKEDGNIQMYSQSLDRSDRTALEAIYDHLGQTAEDGELLGQRIRVDLDSFRQTTIVQELTKVYDQSLKNRYGGEWYAGRLPADYRNTYVFVCSQEDLINECVELDSHGWLNRDIMYSIAATMNKRFLNSSKVYISYREDPNNRWLLHREIAQAGVEARAMGLTFSACGDTLGSSNIFEQAGYGNQSGEDQYGSLHFKCSKGHDNIRPRGKLIPNCQLCGISVKC